MKSLIIALLAICVLATDKDITLPMIYRHISGNDLYQAAQSAYDQMNNVTVSDGFMPLFLGEYAVGGLAGTPPQGLIMLLDTENKYFWVTTMACTTCLNPRFITELSMTFKDLKSPVNDIGWTIGQMTGQASGTTGSDLVAVVGYSLSELKIVAVAKESGNAFLGFWVHGTLGLNYASFKDPMGYINQLVEQKQISKRIVGMYLAMNDTEIKLGSYNEGKAKNLTYIPAYEHQGKFDIKVKEMIYAGFSQQTSMRKSVLMIHSPFMVIPQPVFKPIADKIASKLGKSCYIDGATTLFWCDVNDFDYSKFEGLIMKLDSGNEFTIHPKNLIDFGENEQKQKFAVFRVLVPNDANYIGVGTPFLKSVYTVLDRETDRIGFSQLSFAGEKYCAMFGILLAILLFLF